MLLLLLRTGVLSISKYQIYASYHVEYGRTEKENWNCNIGLYRTKYLFFSTSLGKLIVNLQREARNEFNGSTAWRTPHACDPHDISTVHKIYSSLKVSHWLGSWIFFQNNLQWEKKLRIQGHPKRHLRRTSDIGYFGCIISLVFSTLDLMRVLRRCQPSWDARVYLLIC